MGKYNPRQAPPPPRPYDVHPIWRGIGCLLLLIGPPLALVGGHVLVDMNGEQGWMRMPRDLMGRYTIPGINYTVEHFYATLVAALVLLVLGVGLLMIVYATMYSILGPKRYGPMDSPPVRSSKPKRKFKR